MSCDGFICSNIWAAAALSYAGFDVYRVEILNRKETVWYFDAPSEDCKLIIADYENVCLVLSNAKAYSKAFSKLNAFQNDLRRRGETSYGEASASGADPAAFPSTDSDHGGAGGSGKRVAAAFKRAKGELDIDVEAAGTNILALRAAGASFDEAVAGLSDEALAAAAALL